MVTATGIVESAEVYVDVEVSSVARGEDEENVAAANPKLERAVETTAVFETTSDRTEAAAFSKSKSSSSPEKLGRKRVHQNAILRPLSTKRCLRMNITTRRKKKNAEMISSRSSQSDFSSAVTSCLDVLMRSVNLSCVEDVDFSEAVEASEKSVSTVTCMIRKK